MEYFYCAFSSESGCILPKGKYFDLPVVLPLDTLCDNTPITSLVG